MYFCSYGTMTTGTRRTLESRRHSVSSEGTEPGLAPIAPEMQDLVDNSSE